MWNGLGLLVQFYMATVELTAHSESGRSMEGERQQGLLLLLGRLELVKFYK